MQAGVRLLEEGPRCPRRQRGPFALRPPAGAARVREALARREL